MPRCPKVPPELHKALDAVWNTGPGLARLTAVNHSVVGKRFIVTAFAFLVFGGLLAMLIRAQLATPHSAFMSAETYNRDKAGKTFTVLAHFIVGMAASAVGRFRRHPGPAIPVADDHPQHEDVDQAQAQGADTHPADGDVADSKDEGEKPEKDDVERSLHQRRHRRHHRRQRPPTGHQVAERQQDEVCRSAAQDGVHRQGRVADPGRRADGGDLGQRSDGPQHQHADEGVADPGEDRDAVERLDQPGAGHPDQSGAGEEDGEVNQWREGRKIRHAPPLRRCAVTPRTPEKGSLFNPQTEWREGYIPGGSTGEGPALVSHETACILNAGARDVQVRITAFFADREPAGPYLLTVPARRTRHVRFNDLCDPEPIPRDTDFASLLEADEPVVVQHTRLDSRQAELALITTVAYPVA